MNTDTMTTARRQYERGLITLDEVEAIDGADDWSREEHAKHERSWNIDHLRHLRACRRQDPTRAAYIEGPMWGYVEDFPKHLRAAVIEDDGTDMVDGGRGKYSMMSHEYHGLLALLALANGDITWADLDADDEEVAAAYDGARFEGVEPPTTDIEGEDFGPVTNPDGTPTAFTVAMLTGNPDTTCDECGELLTSTHAGNCSQHINDERLPTDEPTEYSRGVRTP